MKTRLRNIRTAVNGVVEIINEVIEIAKEAREAENRRVKLNLTNDKAAFYDALMENRTIDAIPG